MSKYPKAKFGDFVERIVREVDLEADKEYPSVGVKWYGEGVHVHEVKSGGSFNAERFEIKADDIIYNDMWARNGSVAIVPSHLDGAVASSHFPTFLPDLKRVLPEYLEYYFKTPTFWDDCENASRGSTGRNQIKKSTFYAIEIPLPSLDEQRRIVAHIESVAARVNEAQRLREEAIGKSKVLLNSASAECFKEVKTWRKLGDHLFDLIYRYPTFYNVVFTDSGVGLLKIGNLTQRDWTIDFETKREFIDEETSKRFPQTILESGDLIMAVRGATIGKTAYVSEEYSGFNINANLLRMKPNHKILDGKFFWYFMKSQPGQNQFQQLVTSTAKQTITVPKLKTIEVPVPSLDEQRRIVAYLDGLQAKVNVMWELQFASGEELSALMPSVLDRAFKGEL